MYGLGKRTDDVEKRRLRGYINSSCGRTTSTWRERKQGERNRPECNNTEAQRPMTGCGSNTPKLPTGLSEQQGQWACRAGDDPRRLSRSVAYDGPRIPLSMLGSSGLLGFVPVGVKRSSFKILSANFQALDEWCLLFLSRTWRQLELNHRLRQLAL